MTKKTYTKPKLYSIILDNEISLILMSYYDPDEPPPPPGAASMQANPFEENSFKDNNE